ncbi:MAG: hypothetical protein ACEQSE_12170 [Candidatus Aquirickettsiella gammari]
MPTDSKYQAVPASSAIPISQRIRERIVNAKVRYHANDNIADFIEPGELDLLLAEVEEKL